MTGRSTRHSTTRQWTGLITLLLVSGSASSQGTPTLKEAAPSLHTKAIITDNPSGSVAPLHNVDVSSTTLKYVGQVPAPSVEGTIGDKLPDSFTIKSNGKTEESLSDSKSENLRIQEPLTKVARLEEKRSTNGTLLELSENEEDSKTDDLEDDNNRESTTASPKKEVDKGNAATGNSKSNENEHGVEKPEENVPEIGISLANDTNVNYNGKKPGKSSKNEGALDNDSNNRKNALENATNVIASEANVAYDQVKGKGPKGQVEVVKNSTLPKILRIMETGDHEERKDVEILESAGQKSTIETSESTVIPEFKDLMNADEKMSNLTLLNGDDDDVGKFNDTKVLQTPRGRTISFGSTNDFVTNDNKIRGSIRDNDGITDSPINQIGVGITKESIQEHKSTLKPYPYAKTNFRSNSSGIPLIGDSEISESTDEASALENTIGQRQQNKKFVVTEPSVVIDNSIQQFKPTYYKRSGNSSRIPTNTDLTIATTASSLEIEEKSVTTLSTESIASQNETTVFVSSLSVSNTENDVPRSKDETDKSRIDAKESSSNLDLIGNGITEMIAGIKNDSIRVVEDSVTTESIPATTGGTSMSRATETTLVQNTTETIATMNIDVQTDPEESMLHMSTFNVTEGSTRIPFNQSATNVATLTPSLSLTTLIPESLPQNSMPEISTVSTSTVSKIDSISTPESSSTSTTTSDSPSVTTLMAETSTMSISKVSSMLSSTPMTPSVSTLIPTISSVLTKTSSATNLSMEFEAPTTVTPETSTDVLPPKAFEPAESLSTDETVVSTTSKIEYVFVGLTESTVAQQYMSSSESSNAVKLDSELGSSTPSIVAKSPTSNALTTTTTSLGANDSEASVSTESSIEISTDPVTLIAENDTNVNYTTMSILELTTSEVSTISKEDTAELITTVEDAATTLTSTSVETSTEEVTTVTNSMNVTGIILDVNKNSTETGRAVDSTTSAPGAITGNSSATIIGTAEAVNLSITTEIPKFSEVPKIPITNLTSESPSEISTSERSNTNVTSKSFSSNSTVIVLTTKTSTTTPKPEISATSEGNIDIITDNSILIGRGGGVPSLVKVVFDGSWADVCPHLDVLRQSLADLLTSGLEKTVLASQIIFQNNPCSGGYSTSMMTTEFSVTMLLLYVVDENGQFDGEMTKTLPSLYSKSPIKLQVNIRSFQLVQDSDSGNAIAVVVVSCVALICLVLLAGLLFIMRKRQTRFNYGERCRPVSLDAYSLDSVSAYNSVRRKGAARASKRSYGNPTFEDSSAIPSHPLNFAGLSTFCNEQNAISEEFTGIPQVTARIDELPQGAEVKNRYANVVPLPETRVSLMKINNDPLSEYINASYVRGPKNATKYYIACQAPIESTVTDFWRMIWEQQSKVVIMLTDLVENGVEKCAEYIPPSEVTDCHRLFGDFQVTLKKRETKEKYAISTIHLKNLENNTFREISHIWYLWPANGVQSDAAGLIAVLLEARALQRGGPGPIVVHCSPGTGRTGTLIALDLGIRQYEITRTVDVPRVVYTIRRDRAGAVQTKEQYAFIYKALNLYATKLAGGALES